MLIKTNLDQKDKNLLEIFQIHFPLVPRPFRAIGEIVKTSEEDVLLRTERLIKNGYLKYIGPLINAKRLGFKSALIAMDISDKDIERAASIINTHPGVSHNYEREGKYNLWFTLVVPPGTELDKTVRNLEILTRSRDSLILESLKIYKLKVHFELIKNETIKYQYDLFNDYRKTEEPAYFDRGKPADLNSAQKKILKELETGISILPEPFRKICGGKLTTANKVIDEIKNLLNIRVIRRFGGILHHRNIGYTYNVMAVWKVDENIIDEIGYKLSEFPSISHCYKRYCYDRWPFNLYTMIHAKNKQQAIDMVKKIIFKTGIKTYELLPTKKEHKKKRIRYFSSEHYNWEEKYKETLFK